MKDVTKRLIEFTEIQNELNIHTCGEDWRDGICSKSGKEIDWFKCTLVELGEMLESAAYKHWKHQEEDKDNIKMELVDVLHFILSNFIRVYDVI